MRARRRAGAGLALALAAASLAWPRAAPLRGCRRLSGRAAFLSVRPGPPDRSRQPEDREAARPRRLTPSERAALRLPPPAKEGGGAGGRRPEDLDELGYRKYHEGMRPVYMAIAALQLALLLAAALGGAASQAARSLELEVAFAPSASMHMFSLSGLA